jgi:hypothetical protein
MIGNNNCWQCKKSSGHQIFNGQKWVSIEILIIGWQPKVDDQIMATKS